MDYLTLKIAHQTLAGISLAGFLLRWNWRRRANPLDNHQLNRILPHMFDTLFLASGIALALMLGITPAQSWLAAKLCGLAVYIALAAMAYHKAREGRFKTLFLALALACFAWIISVAITRSPLGALRVLL